MVRAPSLPSFPAPLQLGVLRRVQGKSGSEQDALEAL
jgi:hypothetical protein